MSSPKYKSGSDSDSEADKKVINKKRRERAGRKAEEERDLECEKRKLRALSRKINMTEEERKIESEKLRIRRLKRKNVMTEEERQIENQKVREKRLRQSLRMSEEERSTVLEKRRLATKISRALQTPEEREQRLKRERENKAMRRLKGKQQLKPQSVEISTYTNDQQQQYPRNSPIIFKTPSATVSSDIRRVEDLAEVSIKIENEEVPVDMSDLSEFTFQVAEGLVDPLSVFPYETAEMNLTLVKEEEESTEEFSDSSDETDSDEDAEENSYMKSTCRRTSQLSTLKARAKLAKLRVTGRGENVEGRTGRLAKMAEKKSMIRQLKSKYLEEYSRYKETARHSRNKEPMYTKLVHVPPEKQIAGIVELIKKKNISLTGETPEQRAARIVEDLQREKGTRKLEGTKKIREKRKTRRKYIPKTSSKERRALETPEEKARRIAARTTSSIEKNRMEREEKRIFQIMIASENPVQCLEKDEATPDLLKRYRYFQSRLKKVPDYLKEWRQMINSFSLNCLDTGLNEESQENQNKRHAEQNEKLKQFLSVHEETMKECFSKRKNVVNDTFPKIRANAKKILSEEERETRRRIINDSRRQCYLKMKEERGFFIKSRGARTHFSSFNKSKRTTGKPRAKKESLRFQEEIFRPKKKLTGAAAKFFESNAMASTFSGMPPSSTMSTNALFTENNSAAATGQQWHSQTLCDAADPNIPSESRTSRTPDQEEDGGDDWTPMSQFDAESYAVQNHNQRQSLGSHLFPDVNHSNHQHHLAALNDDLFHQLIHVTPENVSNSCAPQMSFHHRPSGSSNFIQPLHLQHQQHLWNPYPVQSVEEPLNYSIPYIPHLQNALVPSANHASQSNLYSRNVQNIPQTSLADLVHVTKETDVAFPTYSGEKIKKSRPRIANISSPRSAEEVPIPSAIPLVIKLVKTKLKCPNCSMLFKTTLRCGWHIKRCSKIKRSFSCTLCTNTYASSYTLVNHIWKCHYQNKMHKCPLCAKEYSQKRELGIHMRRHPTEPNSYIMGSTKYKVSVEKFWCGLCPSAFDSYLKLIIHRRGHQYVCQICGIILKNSDHLIDHSLRCHSDKSLSLESLCESSHMFVQESGTMGLFNCRICDSHFSTKQFLALHVAGGHPLVDDSKTSYTSSCSCCDIKFRSSYDVDRHLKHCELRNFKCFWCKEKFYEDDLRLDHMIKYHYEEKSIPRNIHGGYQIFKCEYCRRSFDSIFRLRSHLMARHISATTKKSLTEVEKVREQSQEESNSINAVSEVAGTAEVNIETSEIPVTVGNVLPDISTPADETLMSVVVYPCQICITNFKTKDFLEKHMKSAHNSKYYDRLRVICDVCNKRFAMESHLQRHKKIFHSHGDTESYPCPHCERVLTSPSRLQQHIKLIHENPHPNSRMLNRRRIGKHQPEREFKCDVSNCQASFITLPKLMAHKGIVHNMFEVIEFCEVCGKQIMPSMETKQGLKYHIRKHHPDHVSVSDDVASSSHFGFDQTPLKKLSLAQVFEITDKIDEEYRLSNGKQNKRLRINDRMKRRNKNNRRSPEADSEAYLESSSDDDWLSQNSSDDENENSENDGDEADSSQAGTLPSVSTRPPKISMSSFVIKPDKSRKKSVSATRKTRKKKNALQKSIQPAPSNVKSKLMIPHVVLERCD